jgi:arylsulfatase
MISMIDGDYVLNPNLKPAYRADMKKRGFVRGIVMPDYKFARYFSPLNFNLPNGIDDLYDNNDVELLLVGSDETENLAWPKGNNESAVTMMNQKLNALIQHEIGNDDGSETKKGYLGGVGVYDKNNYTD